ncbi:proclotting enzyme-like isoform X1 [Amphibalanus amphitrite]|uniref:proclotting enzyme-like isoform X1 n=1 Tax=Amphibalanus amphitrite TaxID=1232801 RepID=UPI001C919369|nr:proclotting enzyme-like isoform X1 [Amphibalanus amphitrite]
MERRVLLLVAFVAVTAQVVPSAAQLSRATSIADLSDSDLSALLSSAARPESVARPSPGRLPSIARPSPGRLPNIARPSPGRLPDLAGGLTPGRLPDLAPGRRPTPGEAFLQPASFGSRCSGTQECVNIRDCSAFRTREDILRKRPTLCGFSGRVPLVCCDSEGQVAERPPSVLPKQCGKQIFQLEPLTAKKRSRRQVHRRRPTKPFLSSQMVAVEVERFTTPRPVIGGTPVDLVSEIPGGRLVHRWPWMVLFGRWTDAGLGGWFCSGTLITDRHVLTAAHCLRPEEAGTVGARIADHDLTLPDEVLHQQRNVSRIVRHPQYAGAQNDLAVVRLAAPVELTDSVQPICLPPAGADHLGRDAAVAGWGLLEFNGHSPDILQEAPLRVTDPAVCETAYRRVPQFERRFPGGFQGTKVCAESRDGEPRDACRGDSGGPLMVLSAPRGDTRLPFRGTYQLVGVVSTGVGCGNPQFPGLYTKVSAYIDWIVSQLT